MMKRRDILMGTAGLALCAALPAKAAAGFVVLSGRAFGTSWRVTLPEEGREAGPQLSHILSDIDAAMSPFRADSELARFNRSAETGWFDASAGLWDVASEALRVADLTNGAFDPSVGPAVNRFGFGPITGALTCSHRMLAAEGGRLRKREPGSSLDLCGIAKGYAVDRLAAFLNGQGHRAFLIEIGGEVFARGSGLSGQGWRVGIDDPLKRGLAATVRLDGTAVATSGDAVNAYEIAGRRYSHVIDPRTREPAKTAVASVSVLADTAMTADALATALMVMGPERGMAFAGANRIGVLFLLREGDGLRAAGNDLFHAQMIG